MKHLIRITALILCLAAVLVCSACSTRDEDIPEGMQNATAHGADFRLYLPATWNLNSPYGISGGYFSLAQQSTVSVSKYTAHTEFAKELTPEQRIDLFWNNEYKPVLESVSLNGISEVAPPESDLMDGAVARRYQHTYIANGKELRSLQVIAEKRSEKSSAFYAFSFLAECTGGQSIYDQLIGDVEVVLDCFRFASEPYMADQFVKPLDSSADAPAGTFRASNNDVAYRFYAPAGWAADQNNSIVFAHCKDDGSSISVVPYLPETESMTVDEFWTETVAELTKVDKNFDATAMTPAETKLGDRGAKIYEYTCTMGGTTYYYKQVVAAYRSMIYSVTLTASSQETYNAHLAELDTVISAFQFR